MVFKIEFNNNIYNLNTYTIRDIKEVMLMLGQINDNIERMNVLFNYLVDKDNNYHNIDYYEKLYLMIIMRAKLYDNDLQLTYTCPHCNSVSETTIGIVDSIKYKSEVVEYEYKDKIFELRYRDSLNTLIDSFVLDSILIKDVKNIEDIFNTFEFPINISNTKKCILCGSSTELVLEKDKIEELIIPFNIELYNIIYFMKMKGFGIEEILNMYPYELDMFISMGDE